MTNPKKFYKKTQAEEQSVEDTHGNLHYYKLQNEMRDFLDGHYSWEPNSPFVDVPGNFNSDAIAFWIHHLLDNGRVILRIAYGLSVIHNSHTVDEEHIKEAIEALKRGLEKHMALCSPDAGRDS